MNCIALSGILAASVLLSGADFQPLFDGKSLDGWEGDRNVFRVQDGAIVAGILLYMINPGVAEKFVALFQ